MEIAGISLGLREGVIFLISLVAIYMVFVIIRLRQPKESRRTASAAPAVAPVLNPTVPPVIEPAPVAETNFVPDVPPEPEMTEWERAAAAVTPQERLYRGLENEVFQLRDEVDSLRGELAALRVDMLQEIGHMRAAQTVSPIYGDAMQMAISGYDPAMIAERCGIARAEAELVVALAKSQNS